MTIHSNADTFTYGTVVQYTCLDGYRFDTEVYALNVTCAEDGNWQPQIGDCRGKPEYEKTILIQSILHKVIYLSHIFQTLGKQNQKEFTH